MRAARYITAALCMLTAGVSQAAHAQSAAAAKPSAPKLVVVIVIDQFSANLFNQYRPIFKGGLRTLSQGLVYANGYQSHGVTETCPGHSTILTGKRPNKTGITANSWVDRTTGRGVYCLAAPQNTLADGGPGENGRVGPDAMRVDTLGDWLKSRDPKTRVFAVSGKDRGAITLAGHKGDGVFWYTYKFGFTTYVEPGQDPAARLAPVALLNARIKARLKRRPASWTYQHKECRSLEREWSIGGQPWRSTVPPKDFELDNSPLLDELTVEAATVLLKENRLGQGSSTDVLTVSLSATDRIGHRYGTQGPEMCEQMRRLDAALAPFLKTLSMVPGGVIVALTADHGGSDFPERSYERGFTEAVRVSGYAAKANAEVRRAFSLTHDPIIAGNGGFLVVDANRLEMAEPARSQIARAAAAVLRQEPVIAGAYTFEEIVAAEAPRPGAGPEEYTLAQRMKFSAVEGRSPDIFFALQPGYYSGSVRIGGTLSGHGTPWDYDRRVPILFWWPGIAGQERFYAIETVDIAPSLANAVGIATPPDIDGRCLNLTVACPAQ